MSGSYLGWFRWFTLDSDARVSRSSSIYVQKIPPSILYSDARSLDSDAWVSRSSVIYVQKIPPSIFNVSHLPSITDSLSSPATTGEELRWTSCTSSVVLLELPPRNLQTS